MGDITGISWTDHTFNPWWGCTKIAPGCDHCYAATLDRRTGGDYWNVHTAPRRTSAENWRKPLKWNQKALEQGRRRKVFCGSMMDWCDKAAPRNALLDLWEVIRVTPMLDWQLLTKRATLINKRLPEDWGQGYPNVWLGVTVENMEYGYPRIEALSQIPAQIRFLSCEPLLETLIKPDLERVDWLIIGGESGPNYRNLAKESVASLVDYAKGLDIPVWFKQWGGKTPTSGGCLLAGTEVKQWPAQKRAA